ncbi:MAG: hypothetical protein IPL40_00995 [Proteobacteria bacterium]|nr:hypothetical protein [Pseudomonadota bacterium]
MKRSRARGAAASIIALAAALASVSACVGERSFYIAQNQLPERSGGSCVIPATRSSVYRGSGVLDVRAAQLGLPAIRAGYRLYPLLVNDLLPTKNNDDQPERNAILVKGFDVELDLGPWSGVGVPEELTTFSVPFGKRMEPGAEAGTAVDIISGTLARLMAPIVAATPDTATLRSGPIVTATVRAYGDHNGSRVTSYDFVYPVTLCSGCLVQELTDCPAAGVEAALQPSLCGDPQDGPVSCCRHPTLGFTCLAGTE